MLKQLLQDGFNATLFERRSQVGGLWAYDAKHGWTTALATTTANISKYTCGFTDYPIPDSKSIQTSKSLYLFKTEYPVHLGTFDFQEFMQGYAEHFGLLKHIKFDTSVKMVNRNKEDNGWEVEVEDVESGKIDRRQFDKVAFCHGYQTTKRMPVFPGQKDYEGEIIHSQQYRRFACPSTGQLANMLTNHQSRRVQK